MLCIVCTFTAPRSYPNLRFRVLQVPLDCGETSSAVYDGADAHGLQVAFCRPNHPLPGLWRAVFAHQRAAVQRRPSQPPTCRKVAGGASQRKLAQVRRQLRRTLAAAW